MEMAFPLEVQRICKEGKKKGFSDKISAIRNDFTISLKHCVPEENTSDYTGTPAA